MNDCLYSAFMRITDDLLLNFISLDGVIERPNMCILLLHAQFRTRTRPAPISNNNVRYLENEILNSQFFFSSC